MIYELFSNAWVLFYLMVISISLFTLMIVLRYKKTMQDLHQSLTEGDEKINQNFEKIYNGIDLVEREINQVVTISKNLAENQEGKPEKKFTGSDPIVLPPVNNRIKYKKHSKSFKPLSKKYQKFLTPKGKIKKHYRDNPMAQECYQKFHGIKSS